MYKLSLLFFYFRVFPLRQVRLGGYICGGISTAWCVACILAATFQCTPRERLWQPWLPGTCINLFLTQLCISIPSILCDIAILCLPVPHVLRLKTNLTQRILLMFVFLLGSYVVFTSIYRFRIFLLYTADDIPYTLANGCAWNVIEISSGIVSTCLPTLVRHPSPPLPTQEKHHANNGPSTVLGAPRSKRLQICVAIVARRIQGSVVPAKLDAHDHRRNRRSQNKQQRRSQVKRLSVESSHRLRRGHVARRR